MNPDWFWLDLFAADLAKSLSFFRVASQVELLSEVKMEVRQNFLELSVEEMDIFRKAASGSETRCLVEVE